MCNLRGLFATLGMTILVLTAADHQEFKVISTEIKTEYIKTQTISTYTEPVVIVSYETIEHTHDIQLFCEEDAKEIMGVAMLEAGNQGEDGMWLVMSVVVNRYKDSDWPDTIHDVVYQKHAFSAVSKKKMQKVEISEECIRAFARVSIGEICPEIIGFETLDSNVLDQYFDEVFSYKDHKFYTKKK